MNYVIGDIHSEVSKLKELILYICKIDSNPKFIFVGDYIDKGNDAKKTLDYLLKIKNKFSSIFLIGNHEYCWLNLIDYKEYLINFGGYKTIESFSCSNIFECQKKILIDYNDFFDSLVPYYIINHSGIASKFYSFSPDEIKMKNFLFNRYDFIQEKRFFQEKYKVIFGHTSFYKPYFDEYKIGVDTGACYLKNQPLTSFCIENSRFVDSDRNNYKINDLSENFCPSIIRINKK